MIVNYNNIKLYVDPEHPENAIAVSKVVEDYKDVNKRLDDTNKNIVTTENTIATLNYQLNHLNEAKAELEVMKHMDEAILAEAGINLDEALKQVAPAPAKTTPAPTIAHLLTEKPEPIIPELDIEVEEEVAKTECDDTNDEVQEADVPDPNYEEVVKDTAPAEVLVNAKGKGRRKLTI